jgi:hypothetical protein
MEEPKQHIHDTLCSELNEMAIRLKLHNADDTNTVDLEAMKKARERHPKPTDSELIDLIERCRDEMNQCTKPYKIHR